MSISKRNEGLRYATSISNMEDSYFEDDTDMTDEDEDYDESNDDVLTDEDFQTPEDDRQ